MNYLVKLDSLINIIFPSRCLHCAAYLSPKETLCDDCRKNVKLYSALFCGTCKSRLPGPKKTCHKSAPYILGAATDYESPAIKSLIQALKFKRIRLAARPLTEFMIRYAESMPHITEKVLVIPMPLGTKRLRERGFNQSEEIARIFAHHFNLPLFSRALVRIKNTDPQSTLSFDERAANIAGAFKADATLLAGYRTIILIDDVTTSGATFAEASRALKAAGARKIIALAVARAG